MTITDIVTEFGAKYRAEGQGVKDLIRKLMQKGETEALFPVRVTDKTQLEKAIADFARVLQRFQKAWTPVGGVVFTPKVIPLYKMKIDLEEYPDDLEESWLGFLADNDLDRKVWAFTKWWLEGALARAEKDMEDTEIFLGVPGTITPGTATAAGTSMLGLRKQINTAITAGKITPISMGAVPTDPVLCVEYIEDWWLQIPEIVRNEIGEVVSNKAIRDRFRKGMRKKYNMAYDQTAITQIVDTEIPLVGVASHATSTKIWATPTWNKQRGTKKPGNESVFKVESVDRKVKAFTDYYKGVGFWVDEYVYTNDVDLV